MTMREKIDVICDALGAAMQEPAQEGHAEIFLSELERDGFVVVPREPTREMIQAVVKLDFEAKTDPAWTQYWQVMIDAAKGETE